MKLLRSIDGATCPRQSRSVGPRDKVEMADFELICFDLKGKA
jgi:hypothetical protein